MVDDGDCLLESAPRLSMPEDTSRAALRTAAVHAECDSNYL